MELRRDLTEPFFIRSSSFGASEEGRVPGLQCDGAGVEEEAVLTGSHCRHANQSGTGTGLCSVRSGHYPSGCKERTAGRQGFLRVRQHEFLQSRVVFHP